MWLRPSTSPPFLLLCRKATPSEGKDRGRTSQSGNIIMGLHGICPRFMTPRTYPACPLPFFWEREYTAGNPYAGRHISQRGPFSVRCSSARQPSGLAKPSTPPCAMDHSPRGAGAGWLKPYCFNIDNHISVDAPCFRAASAVQKPLCPYGFGI